MAGWRMLALLLIWLHPSRSIDSERKVLMGIGDVYKVELFTSQDQRQFINTHFYRIGAITVTDAFEEAQALADTFVTFFQAAYQGVLSDDVQLGCVKVTKVLGPRIPFFIQFFDNIQGTQIGPPLPDNLTTVIRRRGDDAGKPLRSLLHISGVRQADTLGSFLTSAFVLGNLNTLVQLYNDQMVASASFNLAEFDPVIPHTGYVYGRNLSITPNTALNELLRLDGKAWDVEGFVTGPGFRINAPSKNKGTYGAIIIAGNSKITLTDNELETNPTEVMSVQQVITPVIYFPLLSAIQQTSIRQLSQRRSSHTQVVA